MLLIGSNALNKYFLNPIRNPKDVDLIATYDEFNEWRKGQKFKYLMPHDKGKKMIAKTDHFIYEIEIAWPGSTAEGLIKLVENQDTMNHKWGDLTVHVAPLEALYALKMSHRYLKNNPHFLKTMNDIHLLRKKVSSEITEVYKDWFKLREKETYNYSHPNLNQNKMGFFDPNQGVQYRYDHDSIHVAMAQLENPAYSYYQKSGAEVACDKNKFFSLDEKTRLFGVLEEAYVLALERSQIPFPNVLTPKQSFDKALEKVCTSITSGWFREYAYEHYYQVQELYNPEYVTKFWDAVEKGIVKKL